MFPLCYNVGWLICGSRPTWCTSLHPHETITAESIGTTRLLSLRTVPSNLVNSCSLYLPNRHHLAGICVSVYPLSLPLFPSNGVDQSTQASQFTHIHPVITSSMSKWTRVSTIILALLNTSLCTSETNYIYTTFATKRFHCKRSKIIPLTSYSDTSQRLNQFSNCIHPSISPAVYPSSCHLLLYCYVF